MNDRRLLQSAESSLRCGDLASAKRLLSQLVDRNPSSLRAHELLALIASRFEDLEGFERHLLVASTLPGCSVDALFRLGAIQLQRGTAQAAIATFNRVLQMVGDRFEPLHELGVAHSGLGEWPTALTLFERAEKANSASAILNYNLGNVLSALGRPSEALVRYDRALQLDRTFQLAQANRALALVDLGEGERALESIERALELGPPTFEILLIKASTLVSLHRATDANECYQTLQRLGPDTRYDFGYWIHSRMASCHWEWWPDAAQSMLERVRLGEQAVVPFYLIPLPAKRPDLLTCAKTYARDHCGVTAASLSFRPAATQSSGKIRVGYFSTDFHDHATSQLLSGVIERHDRERFEWHAYALSIQTHDHMTERMRRAFDHFTIVSNKSDLEVSAMARLDGIDIAVDLNGFTAGARPRVFAARAAPIQVNFLGFPASMGCDFMDYIVADQTLIRPNEFDDYSEKVVTLPDSYQPNDDTREVPGEWSTRDDHGLPSNGFVFACFNNPFKITPDVFQTWMEVLGRVPESVLWLYSGAAGRLTSLEREATRHEVEPTRIICAPRVPLAHHLERHRHADLFLDTFHWNAHTTCSDALWAGLPVLTLQGDTFASRVAASLLRAAALPDLIAFDVEGYRTAAVDLATTKSDLLCRFRNQLAERRFDSYLFDTTRYARHLESAFTMMMRRYRLGLPPDHFSVSRIP